MVGSVWGGIYDGTTRKHVPSRSLHLPHPWPTKHQREAMPRLQPLLWELKVEAADAGKVLGEERKLGGA